MMDVVIFDNAEAKTESKMCCISLDGMKKLYELRMMGEPLPECWQSHVWEYLQRKSRSVMKQDVGSAAAGKEKEQYMEAVAIARCLHAEEGEDTLKR